jgi:aromatic-L-amino-acid decarboxylase
MDYGVALGRRFRALKLWFVMRSYGREGIAAMIREHVSAAQSLAAKVDAHPCFERTAPTPFSAVCVRYQGTDDENRQIQERINETGEFFISGTKLHGRFTLRLAIGNMATAQCHVDRVWALIQAEAAKLR